MDQGIGNESTQVLAPPPPPSSVGSDPMSTADGLEILHSVREGQVAAPNAVNLTGVDRIDPVSP